MADVADLERRLEAARRQQRAIGRVLGAVARAEGLQAVLDEVVEAVTLLSGVENGRLWLVEGGLLHAFANRGFEETFEYDRLHPHAIDGTSMAGRTALARALVHVPDVLEDPDYAYAGPRPYRAALSVPILFEGELIGVIGIVRAAPGPFAEEHIELVQLFAEQAAIAIANARLLEAVERQRSELSRFLSPQVAQLITSLPRSAWPSSRRGGASGARSSASGSESRPATRPLAASASTGDTTTGRSAQSPTWPRGSARKPSQARRS